MRGILQTSGHENGIPNGIPTVGSNQSSSLSKASCALLSTLRHFRDGAETVQEACSRSKTVAVGAGYLGALIAGSSKGSLGHRPVTERGSQP